MAGDGAGGPAVDLTPLLPSLPIHGPGHPAAHPHPVVGHVVLDTSLEVPLDLFGLPDRHDGVLANNIAATDDGPAA